MSIHDKKNYTLFVNWLILSLSLIFLMIIIGGLTRLTNSGLSITEWELFKGILPPLNKNDWNEYFTLYKQIPQYQLVNPQMSINEFKIIFFWEYIHRFLGRLIGLFFLVPLIYFYFKNIDKKYLIPCYLVMILILVQGFVGWYMVQSGLVNDVTVSHYRLSLHLSIAIIILSIIFWQVLNLKNGNTKKFFRISRDRNPYLFLFVLIFFQIILGAFVSGLDAGKVYQSWPLMGYNFFPDDVIIKNFLQLLDFENHSLVQFYHRNIAYIISLYSFMLAILIFKKKQTDYYKPVIIFITLIFIQIFLGIFTLLSDLNIALASLHQISSIILIMSALNLYYSIIK